ncbi:MAG: NAD(P)-dependent oxidoreductase [Verrucomicrobiota bacterium]|nr:NAD(P)-dependent oxidoreductase [Verrucomicrobiota bacterium]
MSKNILINLPGDFFIQPELKAAFARIASHGTVRQTSSNTPDEIAADLKWADVVFMWSWPVLDEALLNRAGTLDYVGHIDISQRGAQAELAKGIPISTSRAGFSPAVAEMALGLILNSLRRISDYHAAMRSATESWVKAFPKDINPLERQLTGLTVGIVGLGQVGRRLAHFLKAFEVKLKVVDPFVPESVITQYNGERMGLEPMIECCDVVVLCAASNEGTTRLINADRIARFRPNSILVNVARAALVDYAALAERLQQGDLIAALDVFDVEPLPADSVLRTLPNTYLTPHRAGGLISSVQRNLDWLIEDYEALLANKSRKYAVTEAMIPALDK